MLDKPNDRIYIRLNKIKHAPDAGKSGERNRPHNRSEKTGKIKILHLQAKAKAWERGKNEILRGN